VQNASPDRSRSWVRRIPATLAGITGQLGIDPADNQETKLRKRLVLLLSLGTVPLTLLWTAVYLAAGAPNAALFPAAYSVITPMNAALFAWSRNLAFYRFVQLLMTLILPFGVMVSLGGFSQSSVVIIWAALCPLSALLLEDLRSTYLWILGFVLLLVAGAILQPYLHPVELPTEFKTWFFVLNLGSVITISFLLLYYFVDQRNFYQERAETLLLNILPREISEALKLEHKTIAAYHDAVSILFADVVQFTPMAATISPMHLIDLLNEVFQCFDSLVEKHDVEKIKTIGDCYMVASGAPRARSDHATALVQLALDMVSVVSSQSFAGRKLAIRIGVNSGSVVAGVIGRKKFIYDLWGDTVNLASRMESHGQAQTVQVSRSTYELIKDEFVCEAKGKIQIKGAESVDVWHVIARKA
jgi:adenylate cyclase